jgi:hypothetical protein
MVAQKGEHALFKRRKTHDGRIRPRAQAYAASKKPTIKKDTRPLVQIREHKSTQGPSKRTRCQDVEKEIKQRTFGEGNTKRRAFIFGTAGRQPC